MRYLTIIFCLFLLLLGQAVSVFCQTAVVFDPPDPAHFFENTKFVIIDSVGFVPAFDANKLWSFSLVTGELLDPDGLTLPNQESYVAVFANSRLVVGPFLPVVVDASNPRNLSQIGVLSGIAGENIEVDSNGVIGYIATYWGTPLGKLFSFNVETVNVLDELSLPGDPEQIALSGDRLVIADHTHGSLMVVDVSNPSNLTLAGSIPCPPPTTFMSDNNIVFAEDGRTGFISSSERVLYSFDVIDMTLLDPDGISFGTSGLQSWGTHIAINRNIVACVWTEGGLAFVDVTDPSNMSLVRNANFGEAVLIQGSATPAFSLDGSKVAIATILPDDYVYTFDVGTGNQVSPRFAVDSDPNYLTIYPPHNHVGVVCASAAYSSNIWLIAGLFGVINGDANGDGIIDIGDVVYLINYLFKNGTAPNPLQSADSNCDRVVDIGDVVYLINYLFKSGPPPTC